MDADPTHVCRQGTEIPDFVADLKFKNDHALRPYQREGVNWLAYNWLQRRGSILADEMGLGKTVQAVGFMQWLMQENKRRGPFLIVAPLSTISHWQREIDGWIQTPRPPHPKPSTLNPNLAL